MAGKLRPIVGDWYRDRQNNLYFTVVAIDADGGTVELQHFDGDLEELELKEWRHHDLEAAEAPEDWTGPLDTVDPDEWDQEVKAEDLRSRVPIDEVGAE